MTTAAEWVTRVKEWQGSGKTAPEFCVGRPYKARNLVWWSSHLRRQAGATPKKKGMSWARVIRGAPEPPPGDASSLTPSTDSARSGHATAPPIVIQIGRTRIEISADGDRATVTAVFEALAAVYRRVLS